MSNSTNKIAITKDLGYFAAAHVLTLHNGGCANLHGHNYKVEVTIMGEVLESESHPSAGMLIDFGHIKKIWKDIIEPKLDHAMLIGKNHPEWYSLLVEAAGSIEEADAMLGLVTHLPVEHTTAELMADWLLYEFNVLLKDYNEELQSKGETGWNKNISVTSVSLYETETSIATATV